MKAIMKSIRPQHVCNILNLIKELEISTTAPKDWKDYLSGKTDKKPAPIEVYIYCTKNGKENLQYIWGYNYEDCCGGKVFKIFNKPQSITEKGKSRFDTEIFNEEDRKFTDEFAILTAPLNGKVVARFWCDKVEEIACEQLDNGVGKDTFFYTDSVCGITKDSCLDTQDLINYLGTKTNGEIVGTAIHITKLEIFDKPKEIYEMKQLEHFGIRNKCEMLMPITRAPQSWCYVEV